jgi:hypothetical protein
VSFRYETEQPAATACMAAPLAPTHPSIPIGALERMPKWLICIPLVLQWLVLSVRYRSFTLPSAANPRITAGGLVGEGKLEYFKDMGVTARRALARYCSISTHAGLTKNELHQIMTDAGLSFPVIAKPDLGLCGYGVRLVNDMADLYTYLNAFPQDETVVLQEYLPQEGEAGIFYARMPGQTCGRIIGLALRYFPKVTGDGKRTIAELMAADPRTRRMLDSPEHTSDYVGGEESARVPIAGETVRLATIGSTRIGGLYRDGGALITAQLVQTIDAIARDMPDFHFGRFDVRFDDLASLAEGRGFTIMEINGAGSEAIQAWDPAIGFWQGLSIIFSKQQLLFSIGDAMRRTGVKPIGIVMLAQLNQRQLRLISRYPPSN